jgi:hypothetical protein
MLADLTTSRNVLISSRSAETWACAGSQSQIALPIKRFIIYTDKQAQWAER